ncbi:MAG: DUF4136 domain-containing protein [Chlorobi bacterium]|nr:DUF4136 domain-containing protein [Chlorobiota bacterium]
MKYKFFPIVILSMITLLSCSSVTINYDYDEGQDFSTYRTFKWLAKNRNNSPSAMKDPLAKKKTKDAVIKTLEAKGYNLLEKGEPDFYVIVHAGVRNRIDITNWGYHYGPWYGPNTSVYRYKEGTIFIDVIDGKKKELVWRGTGTGAVDPYYTPEERAESIKEVVAEILEYFPPSKE